MTPDKIKRFISNFMKVSLCILNVINFYILDFILSAAATQSASISLTAAHSLQPASDAAGSLPTTNGKWDACHRKLKCLTATCLR